MKLYRLKIKTGTVNTPDVIVSSYRSSPCAEKIEFFKSADKRDERIQEINQAVSKINLVAWLVSIEQDEIEVIE